MGRCGGFGLCKIDDGPLSYCLGLVTTAAAAAAAAFAAVEKSMGCGQS